MSLQGAFGLVVLVATVASAAGTGDQTTQPGATGAGVVEAVCNRIETSCVFPDDKLFTRRLAYVESSDGLEQDTFRPGYSGGIWQVDQAMFDVTQSSASNAVLLQYIKDIQTSFSIDWPSVSWNDLTKPLYSALGARLYLLYTSRYSSGIPRNISDQAVYWKQYYRPDGVVSEFIADANRLEKGCQSSAADMIFVLDGSGSITSTNFLLIKKFVKDVVSSFDIGLNKTRIGLIQFSSSVRREFNLNRYNTKSDILAAVDRVSYMNSGTATDLALDEMTKNGFSLTNGARPESQGHPRIGIVLTDGESNTPTETVKAARRAHDARITVFAVGVGSRVNMKELGAIASNPVCLHQILLSGFTEMDSLKYAIEKRTCEAPVIVSPAQNGTIITPLPPGGDQNCKIMVPNEGATVQLATTGGKTTFFIARTTYPSGDYYEQKVESSPGRIGVMFIVKPVTADTEGTVFCNIKGDNFTETNISIGVKPGDHNHCKNHTCQNGATCVDVYTDYACECLPGFVGDKCQTDINECQSSPCINGGTCQDLADRFECLCLAGYTGTRCEQEIDNCKPGICNQGTCSSVSGGYVCTCNPGYTGDSCDAAIDRCKPNPCVNGACSNDGVGGFTCQCHGGYTGNLCDSDIDDCTSSPCVNGRCVDGVNRYNCDCTPGYTGKHCESDIDECASSPCQSGDCKDLVNGWRCDCNGGWTGSDCGTDIDECASNPCVTGTCVDKENSYECRCEAGFTGHDCDIPIDACSSNPCQNGDCRPLADGYECCCTDGYNGKFCENEIDECQSNPCVHGSCVNGINKYTCICPPGYTGIHCEIDNDECASNPCKNGDCSDLVDGYVCSCLPGWTDTNCGSDIDECDSSPCIHGDCINGQNHYKCTCSPGFTGTNCQTNIDECESSPCVHGECVDKVNGYVCDCKAGWTGTNCDTDIDECASSPCVHGTCNNGQNHYTCTCTPGYTGTNCQNEIDECESNPCINGQCSDKINAFLCNCNPGYTGVLCGQDIDECLSSPCQHGSCVDIVNGYKCNCVTGWTGTHCDCLINNCDPSPCKNGICENLLGGYRCICMHGYTGPTCESSLRSTIAPAPPTTTPPAPQDAVTQSGGNRRRNLHIHRAAATETFNCADRNPCTVENLLNGKYYFAADNSAQFIQCSEWGDCNVEDCPSGNVWNEEKLLCV